MKIYWIPFILFLFTIGFTPALSAQTLVEYDIRALTWDGNPVDASTLDSNAGATAIAVTGPAAYDTDFWAGSSENMWLAGWPGSLNLSQNFYEFTITANTGFELNLSEISVGVANENGNTGSTTEFRGPITFRLYSNISSDNFTNAGEYSAQITIPHETGSHIRQNVLSTTLDAAYDGITSVTFRIYAYGDAGAVGGGGIANFSGGFSHGGTTFNVSGTSSNVIISGTAFDPGVLTITDAAVSNLGETEATFSSSVPSDGGSTVTGRGFVYAKFTDNPVPEIGGTGVTQVPSGSGTGSFSETVTGLDPVTEYAVRSYASTSSETIYSDVTTFGTLGPELVRYDISALNPYDGNPLSASFAETNVTAHALTFDATDLSVDNDYWGDAPESIFLIGWQENLDITKNYFEFTLEAAENYNLNLSNITAGVGRESGSTIRGPKIFRLYSSIDGFAAENFIAELQLPDHPGTQSLEQRVISTTLGSVYNGIESVIFRIYAYSDLSTGDGGEIPGGGLANFSGNFEINGTNNTVGGTGSDVIISGTVTGPPQVTTALPVDITPTSATLGGNVTGDGGTSVSERGIVWSTSSDPNIDDDHKVVIGSGGTGDFSTSVELLPFGTTIYTRAYATNSAGTAYGDEESFTTGNSVTVDLTGSEGWRLLSAPANVTLDTFLGPIWTQGEGVQGADLSSGTPNVLTWDLDAPDTDHTQYWNAITDLTTATVTPGHSVTVFVYTNDDISVPSDPAFPKTLTVTGTEYASPVSSVPLNTNPDGWTLLGNPFASPVQWDGLSVSNIEDVIYVWDPNNDNWEGGKPENQDSGSWITRAAGIGEFNGVIAPFQGFFVQNSSSGIPSISFSQADKTTSASVFYGKEVQPDNLLALQLSGQGMGNSAWLRFSPDGSLKPTSGDAWQLQPLSSHYALLAAQKDDGSLMDIVHFPDQLDNEWTIPLITEVTRPGTYTLSVSSHRLNGMPLIYLADTQENVILPITEDFKYSFTYRQAAKSPADPFALINSDLRKTNGLSARFYITIDQNAAPGAQEIPGTFALNQNYPNPFNPTTVITYEVPVAGDLRLEIFDLTGRHVATLVDRHVQAGNHRVTFDGGNLSSGVYLYRLQTGSAILTKKLTLIK